MKGYAHGGVRTHLPSPDGIVVAHDHHVVDTRIQGRQEAVSISNGCRCASSDSTIQTGLWMGNEGNLLSFQCRSYFHHERENLAGKAELKHKAIKLILLCCARQKALQIGQVLRIISAQRMHLRREAVCFPRDARNNVGTFRHTMAPHLTHPLLVDVLLTSNHDLSGCVATCNGTIPQTTGESAPSTD